MKAHFVHSGSPDFEASHSQIGTSAIRLKVFFANPSSDREDNGTSLFGHGAFLYFIELCGLIQHESTFFRLSLGNFYERCVSLSHPC